MFPGFGRENEEIADNLILTKLLIPNPNYRSLDRWLFQVMEVPDLEQEVTQTPQKPVNL